MYMIVLRVYTRLVFRFPAYLFTLWIQSLILSLEPARTPAAFMPIAEAIAAVVESDPLPAPWDTDARSAALLVSIAWFESRFTLDAKDAPGISCGLWQTACPAPKTAEWQAVIAYRLVRQSLELCGDLTFYGSGRCGGAPQTMRWRELKALRLLR